MFVDMAETTREMQSCHERVSSSAKQQSLSPHPTLRNCQGQSTPLPQRYDALCCGPEETQVWNSGGRRVSACWLWRKGGERALHLPGSFVAVAIVTS